MMISYLRPSVKICGYKAVEEEMLSGKIRETACQHGLQCV